MFDFIFLSSLTLVGIAIGIEGAAIGFGGFYLSMTKVATLVLLMVGLLQFATARVRMPSGPKTVWLIAFAISLFVSGLYSFIQGTPSKVLQDIWFGYPGLILLYFLLTICVTDLRRLNFFLWGMCAGMLLASVMGLAGVGVEDTGNVMTEVRLAGIAGNANEVAFHLILVIAISLSFIVTADSKWKRIFAIGTFVFLLFALISTVSRAGLLALIVMAGFWMVRFRRLDYLKYAIPFLALAPLFLFLSPEVSRERFTNTEEQGGRFVQAQVALQAFTSNPILGVGPARITVYAQKNGIPLENTIHNVILKYASEHGLFGLVPFLAIVFLSWRSLGVVFAYGRRAETSDPYVYELAWRACYLQVGFVGMAVIAQLHPQQTDKFLWSTFGLATAIEVMLRARIAGTTTTEVTTPEPVAFTPSAPDLHQPPGMRTAPSQTTS